MAGESTGEAPKSTFQFSTPIEKAPLKTSSELRTEYDKRDTEAKKTKIENLFRSLPEMPLERSSLTEGGQIQREYPLLNAFDSIFQNSANVIGIENAQKEMLDIANKVIAQKEAGQSIKPWGATDTETLLLQLEARRVIPPIKTLDKLTIFPKSTLRIIKNILSTPKDKPSQ